MLQAADGLPQRLGGLGMEVFHAPLSFCAHREEIRSGVIHPTSSISSFWSFAVSGAVATLRQADLPLDFHICFSRVSPKPLKPSSLLSSSLHFGDSSGALPCAGCCGGDTYLHSQRNPHFIGTSLDPGRNLEESVSIVLLCFI